MLKPSEYVLPTKTVERLGASFGALSVATESLNVTMSRISSPLEPLPRRLFHKMDTYFGRDILRNSGWEFCLLVDPRRAVTRRGMLTRCRLRFIAHAFPFWIRWETSHFEDE
jgi:hypothetical protein